MSANGYTGNPPGGGGGGGSTAWTDITGKPSTFPPSAHTQAASTISDSTTVGRSVLTAVDAPAARTALVAEVQGTAAGAVTAHVALSDPHIQYALDTDVALKAPLASPTFTGTVAGVTKAMVGLGNVDNTSNATERAAAATLTNKTLTAPVINSPTGLAKADVGLSSVDNTSDAGKPVSIAGQAALDTKQPIIKKWNGSAYVVATGAEIYVGAGTPTSPADGSIWLTS